MKLDRVTMTGPDESIGDPEALLALTADYPFVEWGILVSKSSAGTRRFPDVDWFKEFQAMRAKHEIRASLHLCGRWVRDLLLGNVTFPTTMLDGFQRVQLNFHAENTECNPKKFYEALKSLGKRQFIFQIDGNGGNEHLDSMQAENDGGIDAVPLFDVSGGAGVLPTAWPKPQYMLDDVNHCYHGYAGGLGPQNIEAQLPLIAEAAGDTRIWIDMETHIRSDNDFEFDLDKVRRVLEICAPLIQ